MADPDAQIDGQHHKNQDKELREQVRMPLNGLRLKVRKRGISRASNYVECYSIDLSHSGLAFTSTELKLNEMEKVDFMLIFQNQTIQGTALVRYVHSASEFTRYGLMFLQTLPIIDTVLGWENLTTKEIRQLASSLAEQTSYALREKQDQKLRLVHQRQRFCDALNAYFDRLSEMGIRLPEAYSYTSDWKPARDAVTIDEANGCIDFLSYQAEQDEFVRERIEIRSEGEGESLHYVSSNGESFYNLFEVLAYIGDEIYLVAKLAHFYPGGIPRIPSVN